MDVGMKFIFFFFCLESPNISESESYYEDDFSILSESEDIVQVYPSEGKYLGHLFLFFFLFFDFKKFACIPKKVKFMRFHNSIRKEKT